MISQLIKRSKICDNTSCQITKKQSQNTANSAIAIIIKKNFPSLLKNQILFLKRKTSELDRFSGEICFPGGKQQQHQNLYQTAVRQTYEQTNIQLSKQSFVGVLKQKIFVNYSIRKSEQQSIMLPHFMYVFIFCLSQKDDKKLQIKLNPHEMQEFRWVNIESLLNQNKRVHKVLKQQKMIPFIKNGVSKNKNLTEHIHVLIELKGIIYPGIDIQMKNLLYGLTLYALLLFLSRFSSFCLASSQSQLNQVNCQQLKKIDFQKLADKVKLLESYFFRNVKFLVKQQTSNQQKLTMFQQQFKDQWSKLRPKF